MQWRLIFSFSTRYGKNFPFRVRKFISYFHWDKWRCIGPKNQYTKFRAKSIHEQVYIEKCKMFKKKIGTLSIYSISFFILCKLSNETCDEFYSYLLMYGYKISCSLCALVLDYCQPKSVSFCGRVTRLICLRLLRKSPFIYLMSAVTFGVRPYISLWYYDQFCRINYHRCNWWIVGSRVMLSFLYWLLYWWNPIVVQILACNQPNSSDLIFSEPLPHCCFTTYNLS